MAHKLEVKNLKVSFRTQNGKVQAVRDISFSLDQGETLCIVGESGSGKSVTSKSIMGLLAGNSMIEGGKILYDGKDLLKLSQEEMQYIRGDKISMIFQDPMSSLNPIMRVGKQITEAMLLKNKASRESARNNFNSHLALLKHYLDLAYPGEEKRNEADCKTLDSFCILSTKLELEYNHAATAVTECSSDIGDLIFLIDKKQKPEYKNHIKKIRANLAKSYHRYTLTKDTEMAELENSLSAFSKKKLSRSEEAELCQKLTCIKERLDKALEGDRPNYFRIGYYIYANPSANLDLPISELNAIAREELDRGFMKDFLVRVSKAYRAEFTECLAKKEKNLEVIGRLQDYLKCGNAENRKLEEFYKILKHDVDGAINRLVINKNSTEYTFADAYRSILNEKSTDINIKAEAIKELAEELESSYRDEIGNAAAYSGDSAALELIDYFKEQASLLVTYITKGIAKARAIKLLKEVGIPEPELRYRQYPFEFSGGMRQRIVIAIALAADPEILICDEPTTALDVTIQSQILELINRIKAERKLSVIFITHNLGVVANMADRVAVMYAGKIVECGTAADIFYDPRHPYTWALLSSIPDLDTKSELEAIYGTPPNMIYPPKGDAFAERNKYALEIDYELEPPLFELSPTHYAATWLVHPNAPRIERPAIITERIERMRKRRENDGQR